MQLLPSVCIWVLCFSILMLQWKRFQSAFAVAWVDAKRQLPSSLMELFALEILEFALSPQNFLTHLGDLAFAAAHLSYICWANKMNDQKEIIFMISDLQRKMKPSVPEAIKIFLSFLEANLGILKASKPSGSGASMTVEDGVSSFLNSLLSLNWQFREIKLVKVEIKTICLQVAGTSLFNSPHRARVGLLYVLWGSPRELLICKAHSIAYIKSEVEVVQREQVFLRAFLKDNAKHLKEHEKLEGLSTDAMHIVYQAEYIIHSLVVGDSPPWCFVLWLSAVTEDIEIIERKTLEMFATEMLHVWVLSVAQTSKNVISEVATPKIGVVLSLSNQMGRIINQVRESLSIIGMTGFGNTKLCLDSKRLGMLEKCTRIWKDNIKTGLGKTCA